MQYSRLTSWVQGEGSAVWQVHDRAVARQKAGEDVIVLSIGDPDFATPASIVDRAVASLRSGTTHYTDAQGKYKLRELIASRHQELSGQAASAVNVAITHGAQNAIYMLAQCLLDPGDEVILPEPAYVAYEAALEATGARIVRVPLRAENDFQLEPHDIEQAITARTRLLLVNYPHNPTGQILTHQQAQAIADICKRRDLWLICDEVYALLTYEGEHISPASQPGMAERTAVIGSFSKSHAMTGWRLGWIIAPQVLVGHLYNLSMCMLFGTPEFLQDAAIEAVFQADEIAAGMRQYYYQRLQVLWDMLAGHPLLTVSRPQAGMFVLVDIRKTGLSAYEFADQLLDEQGVSVLPADAFGASAAGFVRLSLTVDDKTLAEACRRMARFAEQWG